jgi:hypothetical protein
MSQEQIRAWREAVEWFKSWYLNEYKHSASEKRVESFCKQHEIPWPQEIQESEEEIPGPYFIPMDIVFGKECEG